MPSAEIARLRDQMAFARSYTSRLLDTVPFADWFRQPGEGVTHVAWQVGHLTRAEYRLGLERIRGRLPADEALVGDSFLASFAPELAPSPDPSAYPPPETIRATFDRVHEQTLREWVGWEDADLAAPLLKPHPIAATKLASLVWCVQHELIHAGQIGLLRRLLGQKPLW